MKKTPDIHIPYLQDVDPAYAQAKGLVTELKAKAAALAAEEADIIHRLTHWQAGVEVTARVAKLLGDDGPADADAPDGLQHRLRVIAGDRADYRRAIEEAERREAAARYAASAKICDGVKAAYVAAVARLAQALLSAHDANKEISKIAGELTTRGVSWTGHLSPLQADKILSGRLAGWLKEAADAGYIHHNSIPKDLQS